MKFRFREARDIVEGLIEYDDVEVIKAAWQYLIDYGHIERLSDPWFRQSAKELIELGICYGRPQRSTKGY